jgi:hypothetical protein
LLVFVEGDTEEHYLNHWWRKNRLAVNVNVDPRRGVPLTLVKYAAAARRKDRIGKGRLGQPYDEVWCVFDCDIHPHLSDALDMAHANGIQVAFSNPCLELWFLLHFKEQMSAIHRHDAQREAYGLLSCKPKCLSPSSLDLLVERFDEANAIAKRLDKKHEGDGSPPMSNPSSNLGPLVERIRTA